MSCQSAKSDEANAIPFSDSPGEDRGAPQAWRQGPHRRALHRPRRLARGGAWMTPGTGERLRLGFVRSWRQAHAEGGEPGRTFVPRFMDAIAALLPGRRLDARCARVAAHHPAELGLAAAPVSELCDRVRTLELEREAERTRTGRRVLGRRAVLAESWREHPASVALRRNLRPSGGRSHPSHRLFSRGLPASRPASCKPSKDGRVAVFEAKHANFPGRLVSPRIR
jgi:hypothetical protein